MMKLNFRGFSLIELLVVIAIIVILSTVGVAIYSDSQKSARDAKRKQDITAISSALEARYNNGTYPPAVLDEWFVGNEPQDPKNTGKYQYYRSIAGVSYMFCAKMEAGSGGNYTCPEASWTDTSKSCTGPGVTKQINGGYFCLTQRQ